MSLKQGREELGCNPPEGLSVNPLENEGCRLYRQTDRYLLTTINVIVLAQQLQASCVSVTHSCIICLT